MSDVLVRDVHRELVHTVSWIHLLGLVRQIRVRCPYPFHPFSIVHCIPLPEFAILVRVARGYMSFHMKVAHSRFDVSELHSMDGL